MDIAVRTGLIKVAAGKAKADLLIKNANVFNVFTCKMQRGNVAVYNGYIAGIGEYTDAKEIFDAEGQYLVPGFINAHCHIESSMVSPEIYCASELRYGTTTIITDPHEAANVAGLSGIKYILDASKNVPINCFIQLPSCVPATMYEQSGTVLSAADLKELINEPRVLGLAEMMDYYGVLDGNPEIMDKLNTFCGRVVDGHAPGLTGLELNGYVSAGISTEHECTGYFEAMEKLTAGIAVLIREGGSCKNLEAIITGIIKDNLNTDFTAFCTDDMNLPDIMREGTIRRCIQKAIALGLDPVKAYRMATINPARIYRLSSIGAIAPGYRADMVVLSDFENVIVSRVFKDGRDVTDVKASAGAFHHGGSERRNSVSFAPLSLNSFDLPSLPGNEFPVIGIVPGQILTEKSFVEKENIRDALDAGTLNKIAAVERHHATGNVGVGLVKGYGLIRSSIAGTVCHDSHNLIIVGTDNEDMLKAAMEVERIKGGFALVSGGKVIASLPLPLYGIMSDKPADEFIPLFENMLLRLFDAGVSKDIDPLLTMSFLALPVIPEIRITPGGIFDVAGSTFL